MDHDEKLIKAAEIILENILTPIIYLSNNKTTEFIVYSGENKIENENFRKTAELIYTNLGITSEIIDIREFTGSEILDILSSSRIIYADDDSLSDFFSKTIITDIIFQETSKLLAIERKNKTGSYYTN